VLPDAWTPKLKRKALGHLAAFEAALSRFDIKLEAASTHFKELCAAFPQLECTQAAEVGLVNHVYLRQADVVVLVLHWIFAVKLADRPCPALSVILSEPDLVRLSHCLSKEVAEGWLATMEVDDLQRILLLHVDLAHVKQVPLTPAPDRFELNGVVPSLVFLGLMLWRIHDLCHGGVCLTALWLRLKDLLCAPSAQLSSDHDACFSSRFNTDLVHCLTESRKLLVPFINKQKVRDTGSLPIASFMTSLGKKVEPLADDMKFLASSPWTAEGVKWQQVVLEPLALTQCINLVRVDHTLGTVKRLEQLDETRYSGFLLSGVHQWEVDYLLEDVLQLPHGLQVWEVNHATHQRPGVVLVGPLGSLHALAWSASSHVMHLPSPHLHPIFVPDSSEVHAGQLCQSLISCTEALDLELLLREAGVYFWGESVSRALVREVALFLPQLISALLLQPAKVHTMGRILFSVVAVLLCPLPDAAVVQRTWSAEAGPLDVIKLSQHMVSTLKQLLTSPRPLKTVESLSVVELALGHTARSCLLGPHHLSVRDSARASHLVYECGYRLCGWQSQPGREPVILPLSLPLPLVVPRLHMNTHTPYSPFVRWVIKHHPLDLSQISLPAPLNHLPLERLTSNGTPALAAATAPTPKRRKISEVVCSPVQLTAPLTPNYIPTPVYTVNTPPRSHGRTVDLDLNPSYFPSTPLGRDNLPVGSLVEEDEEEPIRVPDQTLAPRYNHDHRAAAARSLLQYDPDFPSLQYVDPKTYNGPRSPIPSHHQNGYQRYPAQPPPPPPHREPRWGRGLTAHHQQRQYAHR
jgi:hypothetical protein